MIPYNLNELQLLRVLLAGLPGEEEYTAPHGQVNVPKLRTKLDIHIQREKSRGMQNGATGK